MFSKEKIVSVSCLVLMTIPVLANPLLVVKEQLATKDKSNNYIYVEPETEQQKPKQQLKVNTNTNTTTSNKQTTRE
jgi:hypothetical protein